MAQENKVTGLPSRESQVTDLIAKATLSWRAVFAGVFIALLAHYTLMALGLAAGGKALQGMIAGNSSGGGFGIGAGIWLIVSAMISLFIGAYSAARVSGLTLVRVGRIQGAVITAIFFAFMFSQVGSAISLLGKGVGSVLGTAGSAVSDLSSNPQVQSIVENAIGENTKSPPDVVVRGLATRLIRGDTDGAIGYLSRETGITRAEATSRIQTIQGQVQSTVQSAGQKTAHALSIAGWSIFISLVLGTIFGMLGGGVGSITNLRRPLSDADLSNVSRGRPRAA